MKEIFKKIIILIITLEARVVLMRFKPKIIAVTGSVGKTSTKDAIYTVLSQNFHIRKNQKSLNSETGVPLTILGLQSGWDDPVVWLQNILQGFLVIFGIKYPKWLVLEIGVDHPGDMERIARWLKPDIAVITTFPNIPAHVEFFKTPEDVIDEKRKIIKYLNPNGALILNADDEEVLSSQTLSKSKVYTYGFNERSDVKVSNNNIIYEDSIPTGTSFKVTNSGNTLPVTLDGVLGVQHIYPFAAALALGLIDGISSKISLLDMAKNVEHHEAPKGRMSLVKGKNGSVIIDDSYNASPLSMEKALETLAEVETDGGKVAVLGDMLEIGNYSAHAHKKVGCLVNEYGFDHLFTVGIRAEYISNEAMKRGMYDNKIHHFGSSKEAISGVLELLKSGTTVLIKGSQSIRMEKITEGIMAEPEKKKDLLVRQEEEWERR